ncbi:MAG: hypothetical protein A2177_15140 [Spirochaetes bacterium RBG_13_68_11]|nr:MAG: hypothetical protein A2177_15140 [Spirochaetes bacterium RBG_13_68_11]
MYIFLYKCQEQIVRKARGFEVTPLPRKPNRLTTLEPPVGGVGPVFPLLMARGSREFPEQSGAVSGVLYAGISLGGMAFPLLVGALAQNVGIARSYWFCAAAAGVLLVAALAQGRAPAARPLRPAPA